MAGKAKLHRFSDVEYKDHLSGLPDEILICSILSRLPMKEAAKTSILSHRWRFLWSSVPCLDFDALEELTRKGITMDDPSLCKEGEAASKFVRWVDGAIGAYRGLATLRYFRVRFHLYCTLSDEIDSWLMFALGKQGVEVLELDCCWDFGFESPRGKYWLNFHPFPKLRLLKSLTLRGLNITDYSLGDLLLGCAESLETLQLQSLQSITRVKVTGPVSKLKHIHILNCYYVRSIMISAPTPDLVSFIYPGGVDPLHVEHAPRLVDLFICQNTEYLEDFDLVSHPLFRYISQLQTLHLEASSWHMAIHWLPHLPDLTGLKHLKLTVHGLNGSRPSLQEQMLRGLASLMEAARCVQHITLECSFGEKVEIREEFADLHLELLRVIEIVRFQGRKDECELALQLVKAAAVSQLEKLILDCRDPLRRGFIPSDCAIPQRTIRKWKKRARKLIQPMLPSKVELVLI